MTAKIAKFPFVGFQFVGFPAASGVQVAPHTVALAHSNDNTKSIHATAPRHRGGRPVLACHWRPTAGGGLECWWAVEPANGATTEDPYPSRMDAAGMSGLAHAA
jgi:hypothetical protein